jgi:hypothetical protein
MSFSQLLLAELILQERGLHGFDKVVRTGSELNDLGTHSSIFNLRSTPAGKSLVSIDGSGKDREKGTRETHLYNVFFSFLLQNYELTNIHKCVRYFLSDGDD